MNFNFNPYSELRSHIPYTHYMSTRIKDLKVLFIYGSIVDKLNAYKVSLDVLKGSPDILNTWGPDCEYLGSEDQAALIELNNVLSPLLGELNIYPVGDISAMGQNNIRYIEDYLCSSNPDNGYVVGKTKNSDTIGYPYNLNVIDTGVPTDNYYEIRCITDNFYVVIVYAEFINYITSSMENMITFIRHLLIKCYEQLTIEEVARLNIFTYYLKFLGTRKV